MLVLDYIVGMLVSLLPEPYRTRYRPGIDLYRAAMLSGVAESAACLTVLFVRYVDFILRRLQEMGNTAVARGRPEALAAPGMQYGAGFVALLEFAFHPLSVLLAYLALEGLARFLAAAVTKEAVGTMPLYLAAQVYERLKRAHAVRPGA
jgi:hypothetical protein